MLIKLNDIVDNYHLSVRGVIHIGAHYGQEYKEYVKYDITNMMFFEPIKDNYRNLLFHVPNKLNIKTYNIALGNEVGVREMYVEKVKGQSCSFLEPGTHLELHPHIKFTDKEEVSIMKLDDIIFDRILYNMINIDVQGFELEVFKGAVETLKSIDILYTEVNFEEVYKGCCLVGQLDEFLKPYGFVRVFTKDSDSAKNRKTWGDALYIKKPQVIDFNQSIQQSYCFNQNEYDVNQNKWQLLKDLYQINFIEDSGKRDYKTLPKRIHQIWLGSDPLPWHTKLADTWKKFHPHWEYRLWTDKDVDEILPDRSLYNLMTNNGQKSDYLRYYILEKFGGLYVDTDFECLKSFDSLTYLNFLMGVGYPMKVEFYNALIACTPHHPIIKAVIESITKVGGNSTTIFDTTGGRHFTLKFFEMQTVPSEGILILPTDYFYPYPNKPGFEGEEGRKYIKDCSYTIHFWELLWINAHKKVIETRKQLRKF